MLASFALEIDTVNCLLHRICCQLSGLDARTIVSC